MDEDVISIIKFKPINSTRDGIVEAVNSLNDVDTVETPSLDSTIPVNTATPVNNTSPVIDENVMSLLRQTGQVGNNSLNKRLYGNSFIKPIGEQITNIEVPETKAQDYSGLSFLSDDQKQLFTQSSEQIAEQSNLTRDALTQSLSGQVRAIESASQDRAVIAGIQTGQLGATPEKSTRNLSFIADAQAVAQQQMIDTTQEFVNQLGQIDLQTKQQQTELLGQAVKTQQAERGRLDELANMMTQSLGTLHSIDEAGNIMDTGVATLQGRASELDLTASQFQLGTAQAEASEMYQLDEQGMIKFDSNGQAMVTDLGDLRRRADLLIAQADTTEAKMAIESMYKQQELMNMFSSPGGIAEAQDKFGTAFGRYYGIEQGEDGTIGFYDESALSQIGLDLNTTFQGSQGSMIERENINEIRQNMALDISKSMFAGESASFMNKIYAESDDKNSMLFALRNYNNNELGYNFFEVNTAGLSAEDKVNLNQKLSALDPKDKGIFDNFLKVTGEYEAKGLTKNQNVSAFDFITTLKNGRYNSAANNELISGVKTPQLIGAVLMGTTAGSLKNLENMNLVQLNDEGFLDFEPLKSSWVTNGEDALKSLSGGNLLSNPFALQKAFSAYNGTLNPSSVSNESRVYFEGNKEGGLQFTKQTRTMIDGLVNVQKFMEKSIKDKARLNDTYKAFLVSTMGSYGVDGRQADSLLALVDIIRTGGKSKYLNVNR